MQLSKQDMFCEAQQPTANTTTVSTDVLDFGKHGDDILGKLFWSLFVAAASTGVTLQAKWFTSDTEDFSSESEVFATSVRAADDLAAGTYLVRNEPLPKGLKRYNRLKFVCGDGTTAPKVTAFLHDGRDEGTPFTGL